MPRALYVHWPFCKAKCPYCDFNSHVRENVAQDAWRQALLAELRWYAAHCEPQPLSSIFFGGGTPSLMPPETVAAVIAEAQTLFGFTEDIPDWDITAQGAARSVGFGAQSPQRTECKKYIEITLEANPTSVEAERFRAYAAAGVNRLSLGIQSLTPRHLTFLGRQHSAAEARAAIELAATIFPRYSFDLIYALADQSLAEWEQELQAALALAGDHLSLYQLTIEPGTQFYHLHQAGKLPVLSTDESAAYYELTQQLMEAVDMPAYEISNHAIPGGESRHNLAYWRGGEYFGIGPGAHGRIVVATGRSATINLRSPEKWLEQVQRFGHGQESNLVLSEREILEERILMGIRLREGLPREEFVDLWPQALLTALQQEELIGLTPTHLVPTAKGRLVLNALVEKLVSALPKNKRKDTG